MAKFGTYLTKPSWLDNSEVVAGFQKRGAGGVLIFLTSLIAVINEKFSPLQTLSSATKYLSYILHTFLFAEIWQVYN
jgi:hypothetical protein